MLKNSVILFPGKAHLLLHGKPLRTVLARYLRYLAEFQTELGDEGGRLCEQFALVGRVFYY